MDSITRRDALQVLGGAAMAAVVPRALGATPAMQSWPLNTANATGIHDVAPAPDGGVWFTAQRSGHLGWFAVYVDERDIVWVADWSSNAMFSFDPRTEKFDRHVFPREAANVRQMLGRRGEVWLPESGTEFISVIRTI
ncbi:MAG: hypothetical protein ABIO63_10435 [Casimicrobiaceae bacterium]